MHVADVLTRELEIDAEDAVNGVFPASKPAQAAPKRMGRPPNPDKDKIPHLDKPPGFHPKPLEWLKYWQEQDRKFPNRLAAYVYRTYPVIDRAKLGKPKNIEVMPEPFAASTKDELDEEVTHRWGSGGYKFILHDGGLGKAVVDTKIIVDDQDHPPLVDIDELELANPQNRDFIANLKRRGVVIPGEPQQSKEKEGEDMAAATTIAALSDTVSSLVGRVVENADKRVSESSSRPEAAPVPNAELETTNRSVRMMADTADASRKMMSDTITEVMKLATRESDTGEKIKAIVDLVKALQPAVPAPQPWADNPESARLREDLKASMNLIAQMRDQEMQTLRREIQELRTSSTTIQTTAAGVAIRPAGSEIQNPINELEKILKIADQVRGLSGGAAEEAAEKSGPWWVPLATMAMPLIAGAMNAIQGIVYNMALSKTGQGQAAPPVPIQPPEMQGYAGAEEQQPGMPMPPVVGAQQQQQPQEADPMSMILNFLHELEQPLLKALDRGDSGDAFAESLINFKGRMPYNFLKEHGKEVVLSLLRSYPPIWSKVQLSFSSFNTFLDEFLDYDNIVAREQAEDDAGQSAAQPVIQIPPVRKVRVKPEGVIPVTPGPAAS